MKFIFFFLVSLLFSGLFLHGQSVNQAPKGSLFIIGGGARPPSLMSALIEEAHLKPNDYIAVLAMSSAEPDTSFYYFKKDLDTICKNKIVNLNFKASETGNRGRIDSLANSQLIFITGGDQERFMQVVLNTPVYAAIHRAYAKGATIAGTSAGAAVMSQHMITGRELVGDTTLRATYRKVRDKNIEIKPGLGLLTNVVIDQHFIVRSRFNRLLSALAKYPDHACIGIDEATAIVVRGTLIKVVGQSQVLLLRKPSALKVTSTGLIKFDDVQFSLFTDGDSFDLLK